MVLENKESLSEDENFGKVIDALHNKSKLSSLRTYQGDMAEFIKSKNESVISIAVKEKEREEEREEEEEKKVKLDNPVLHNNEHKPSGPGFQINIAIFVLSLFLIFGGVFTFLYVYESINSKPIIQSGNDEQIIPYNNIVTLANVTDTNLGTELSKIPLQNGVSIIKVSDIQGRALNNLSDLLNFLKVSLPPTLLRTLGEDYVLGATVQGANKSHFLVLKVNEFGQAFTGMLEWENQIANDLNFLSVDANLENLTDLESVFVWKDIIVKNKDTRAFVDVNNSAKLAYTFLDKNTILLTTSTLTIGELSGLYASRSVSR